MDHAIAPARPEQMDQVRALFREYRASVDAEICFASYESELDALPSGYEVILLADSAGCVALRRLTIEACEMKRLFVRPQFQGTGLGVRLIQQAIAEARHRGYHHLRLDTLPTMQRAIELYRKLGFQPIARYNDNPDPGTIFFELLLR